MVSLPEHLASGQGKRGELPREVREEYHRARIVDASIGVFAKRGYRGTTVDHIVAAAEVSFSTFYSVFEGKEECFLQAFDLIVREGREQIAAVLPEGAPWREQTAAALDRLVEAIAEEPLRARVALVEAQTGGPRAFAAYQELLDSLIPPLRKGREENPATAELSPTLEEATVGGGVWLLHQQLLQHGPDGVRAALPELMDIVLGPYIGVAEASRMAETMAAGD
jgi:AcrR family transcriptional regulator